MSEWDPKVEPPGVRPTILGALLALLRVSAIFVVTYGGLMLLLLVRMVERPLAGLGRPVSPFITQGVCRAAFFLQGISYKVVGTPMEHPGAIVANHSSWLDIFSLNACQRVYFVSKAEVRRWPLIGWLARATGTVFIERDPKKAKDQQALFEARIRAGHKLLFFPEGTSTDGRRVLTFKSTLFAAFYTHGLEHVMHIQPVSVYYRAPKGRDPRTYGWWGDMEFAHHFLQTLMLVRQGSVEVTLHEPVSVDAFATRKDLAAYCEGVVRASVEARMAAER